MAMLSREAYETILKERTEVTEKLRGAVRDGEEFLITLYNRMLRAVDKTYNVAIRANVTLERKELRAEIREARSGKQSDKSA